MIGLSIASLVIAYLLGSIPTAYIMGRLRKGIDIRKVGSGNMGTMNVLRTIGVWEAAVVFLIDAGKGIASLIVARSLGLPVYILLLSGAAAIAGHIYPVFLRFKGGIGGATGAGIQLFLMPWGAIPYFILTGILFFTTRNLTAAYGVAFIVFPFIGWFVYHSLGFLVFSVVFLAALAIQNSHSINRIRTEGLRKSIIRSRLRDQ